MGMPALQDGITLDFPVPVAPTIVMRGSMTGGRDLRNRRRKLNIENTMGRTVYHLDPHLMYMQL